MCPICMANLAMMATAATSTGGAATIFINKFRAKKDAKETMAMGKLKELEIEEKAS
jgi:hypothetical protein